MNKDSGWPSRPRSFHVVESPPKLLLLVNSDPRNAGIGELFLREVGEAYPSGRLVRYSTIQTPEKPPAADWLGFKSEMRFVRSSRWPVFSSLCEVNFSVHVAESLMAEIKAIIVKEQIDFVWAVLTSGPIITLTERLLNHGVQVISTVQDDPHYFFCNQFIDRITARVLERRFARVLQMSRRVSVICESMGQLYKERYGVDSIVMRHGVKARHLQPWKVVQDGEQVRIGFAGSLYAKNEWNALLKTLDSRGGRIGGREIRISLIGRMPRRGVRNSPYVDHFGSMSFEATLEALNNCHVAYLPYWFDRRHSSTVQTSFPGKLSTYAACGLPVLYHGPRESSVSSFLEEYPFGVCCHSLVEDAIELAIMRILEDKLFRAYASEARDRAMRNELGHDAMLGRFSELIG